MTDRLAAPSDLATWLGVTTADNARSTLALEVATGWVQGYTGQKLVYVTNDTVTLTPRGASQRLYLPERPVDYVTSVTYNGTAYGAAGTDWTLVDDYLWTGYLPDAYNAGWRGRFTYWPPMVTVTYTHGYPEAPQDIRGVVLAAAARVIQNPAGVQSQTVGGVSWTVSGGATGATGLTATEKAALAPYRQLVVV